MDITCVQLLKKKRNDVRTKQRWKVIGTELNWEKNLGDVVRFWQRNGEKKTGERQEEKERIPLGLLGR